MIVTILAQYLCPQAKEVEKTAIEEGIRENGAEDSDKVIQAVLAARHAQVRRLTEWLIEVTDWLSGWLTEVLCLVVLLFLGHTEYNNEIEKEKRGRVDIWES